MKVLLVYDQKPSPENLNGMTKVLCNILPRTPDITYDFLTQSQDSGPKQNFNQVFTLNTKKDSTFKKMINWLFRRTPISCADKTTWHQEAAKWVDQHPYDVIHIFGSHNIPILYSLSEQTLKKTIISSIDCMSLFFERRYKQAKLPQKALYYLEYCHWQYLEQTALNKAKLTHVVSRKDQASLQSLGVHHVEAIENGVASAPGVLVQGTEPMMTFWGDLGYAPNKDAVYTLCKILAQDSSLKLKIFGKNPPKQIIDHPQIDYRGFVDDIFSQLTDQDYFICPLSLGAGIKNKLLEAFIYQVPVITSSLALEGIDPSLQEKCIVLDDLDIKQWTETILNAFNNYPEDFKSGAQKLTLEQYSWSQKQSKLKQLYNTMR